MMKIQKVPQQKGTLAAFMNLVERVCNRLPPPAILFCLLFVLTALLGALFTEMGVHLENPATHHIVTAQNFFSKAGIQWLLTNMVKNFTGFAPLGLVITMTMAIGFCEESGLLVSLLNRSMRRVPTALVPYLIAFVGTLGNIASDTAAVVIPPLGALVLSWRQKASCGRDDRGLRRCERWFYGKSHGRWYGFSAAGLDKRSHQRLFEKSGLCR